MFKPYVADQHVYKFLNIQSTGAFTSLLILVMYIKCV